MIILIQYCHSLKESPIYLSFPFSHFHPQNADTVSVTLCITDHCSEFWVLFQQSWPQQQSGQYTCLNREDCWWWKHDCCGVQQRRSAVILNARSAVGELRRIQHINLRNQVADWSGTTGHGHQWQHQNILNKWKLNIKYLY